MIKLITYVVMFCLLALVLNFIIVMLGGTAVTISVGYLAYRIGVAVQLARAAFYGACAGWTVAASETWQRPAWTRRSFWQRRQRPALTPMQLAYAI